MIFIYKIRGVAISHCCMSIVQLHLLFNSGKASVSIFSPFAPLAQLFLNNLDDVLVLHDVR